VLDAVHDGRLDAARLASFQSLEREIDAAARRADIRAARAQARAQGRMYKQIKEQLRRNREL
jgi:hypothetical protein